MIDINYKNDKMHQSDLLYSHILLATDGRESAIKAEEYALCLAKSAGAGLTVVYIMDDSLCHYGQVDTLAPAGTGDEFSNYVVSERESCARKVIERFNGLAESRDVGFDLEIRQGNPAQEIAAISAEIGADLVIIGGKKSPGVWGVKFTGTADKVASRCRCSVMIIT